MFHCLVAGDEMAPAACFYRHKMTTFLNRHFYVIFTAPLTAREAAGEESDIDIVIEQREPDLFVLGSIKTDLENEFDREVDIVRIREGMNAFLKDRIEREAIYV